MVKLPGKTKYPEPKHVILSADAALLGRARAGYSEASHLSISLDEILTEPIFKESFACIADATNGCNGVKLP